MAAGRHTPPQGSADRNDRPSTAISAARGAAGRWAAAGQPDDRQPAAVIVTPTHCRVRAKAEDALGEHREEDEPAGEDRFHDRERRERERADVHTQATIATIQPTKNHLERNQTDGAGQRMAGRDRRGQHSAALFSTEDEVGGRRRSEGEDWSEDHDKAWTPRGSQYAGDCRRPGLILVQVSCG
jgi:hypothetical protein